MKLFYWINNFRSFFGTKVDKVQRKGSLSQSRADTKVENKITNEKVSGKIDKKKVISSKTNSNKAYENTLIKSITNTVEKNTPIKRKKESVNDKESSDEDSPLIVKKKKRRTKLDSSSSEDSLNEPMNRSVKPEPVSKNNIYKT